MPSSSMSRQLPSIFASPSFVRRVLRAEYRRGKIVLAVSNSTRVRFCNPGGTWFRILPREAVRGPTGRAEVIAAHLGRERMSAAEKE